MKAILEKHPGELFTLAFLAMGIGFVIVAVLVEMMGPIAGQSWAVLLDGADYQKGLFPAP